MALVIPDTSKQNFDVTRTNLSRTPLARPTRVDLDQVFKLVLSFLVAEEPYIRLCYYEEDGPIEILGEDFAGKSEEIMVALTTAMETGLVKLKEGDYIILHAKNGCLHVQLA